jgi:hypothetical protein
MKHRPRTHVEDPCDIPHPTAIATHSDDRAFDLGSEPLLGVGAYDGSTLTRRILTAQAWLAISRLAIFHHRDPMTCRTVHRFAGHHTPLGAGRSAGDAVPSAVWLYHGCSRKSTNPEHYRQDSAAANGLRRASPPDGSLARRCASQCCQRINADHHLEAARPYLLKSRPVAADIGDHRRDTEIIALEHLLST